MAEMQDLIVIGGGSGGFAAAIRAAQLGGKVTVIEEAHYGGNCMNRACIPSKLLLTTARLMSSIRKAGRLGIQVEEPKLDMDVLHHRKDLMIKGFQVGTERLLAEWGITLVRGQGRLVARDTVEVEGPVLSGVEGPVLSGVEGPVLSEVEGPVLSGVEGPVLSGVEGKQIRARNLLVATGSVAAQPPIEGVDLPGVIGTEEAIELRQVPARIAILGSKPWDLELAQYFHLTGSEVTLIESGPQLLPEADCEISQRLGKLFHDAGMVIQRGVAVEAIRRGNDGTLVVVLDGGKGEVVADKVLAAHRLPNSAGLGLHELGVKLALSQVEGPVLSGVEGPVLSQVEGPVLSEVEGMGQGAVLVNERMETSVPHIYAVGDVTAGPMWSHKASCEGIIAGQNAMGLNSKIDYSVHIMAPGAVDLINIATVAMLSEATVDELMRLIPAHPAIGEAMVDAAMDVEKRSPH